MNKQDAKALLDHLRELGKTNVVIDTFLRQAEVEIRMEFLPEVASQEYIDNVLIDKHLLNVAKTVISLQASMISNIESEMATKQ